MSGLPDELVCSICGSTPDDDGGHRRDIVAECVEEDWDWITRAEYERRKSPAIGGVK